MIEAKVPNLTGTVQANLHTVLACSFNQTAGPGATLYDASKQHVHGKFHILSLESIFLETYLALEMSLSNV